MKCVLFALVAIAIVAAPAAAQPGILERLNAIEARQSAAEAREAARDAAIAAQGQDIKKILTAVQAQQTYTTSASAPVVTCGPNGCTVTTASQCQAGCSGVPQVGAYQSGGVMFAQSNSGGRQGLLARLKARRAGGGGCGG